MARLDPVREHDLLAQARLHDQAALALIFDTYYDLIFRYIYVRVGHRQTSEDLAAQVFQRLLAHLHDGRGPDHFLKAWLFRVAENLIVDDARRQIQRDQLPLDAGDPVLRVIPNDDDVLALSQVRAALSELPPTQQQAVTLRYLLELSNEEIATIMNLSIGAAKAHVHRGLMALREKLRDAFKRETP